MSVAFEEFPNIPPCMSTHHKKKKTTQFMNSRTFCFIRLSRLGGWLVFLSFLSPYIQDAAHIQLFVINVKNGWFFSPLSFFNLQNYTVKRSNPFSLIILVSLHMMIQVYNKDEKYELLLYATALTGKTAMNPLHVP